MAERVVGLFLARQHPTRMLILSERSESKGYSRLLAS